MKKSLTKTGFMFFVLAAFIIMFSASCSAENDNLLYNSDFEILNAEGLPDGWYTDAYRLETGFTVFSVTEGMDGKDSYAVQIRNAARNDARYAQTVEVEPETMYCLSGYIRAEDITFGHGANLSIEGIYAFSEKLYNTEGEWQKVEYYGETGPEQHEITVFARVGGYSGESKGCAVFDHISLTRTDTIPEGVFADLWYQPDDYKEDDEGDWDADTADIAVESPENTRLFLLVIGVLYLILLSALIWFFEGKRANRKKTSEKSGLMVWLIMLAALGLRILLAFHIEGYSVDVNCFASWGATMVRTGPVGLSSGFGGKSGVPQNRLRG